MNTKVTRNGWSAFCLGLLFAACSSGSGSSGSEEPNPVNPPTKKIPITLSCGTSNFSASTRVTDQGYDAQDKIGLFVVNYQTDGTTPGSLQLTGNHVDNMCFTYNGTWAPTSPIYWEDDKTPADFYAYYPYNAISNINAHSFGLNQDQSSTNQYKASEFLWGKATKVAPTESAVKITTRHLMSCALIKVAAGNGFTAESLAASQVSVTLNGLQLEATIDLTNGAVTATGEAKSVTPLKEDNNWRALVVPQTVTADNFININVDGRDFKLKKENFTFVSGKRHNFTVTVSKTSNGVNVEIGEWEDDGTDEGGTAE